MASLVRKIHRWRHISELARCRWDKSLVPPPFCFQDCVRQLYPYLAVSCASNERLGASLVSSLNTTNWLSRSRVKKHIKTHLQQHTRNLAWDTLKLQRYSRIFTKVAKRFSLFSLHDDFVFGFWFLETSVYFVISIQNLTMFNKHPWCL